jgi:hypothetical protein
LAGSDHCNSLLLLPKFATGFQQIPWITVGRNPLAIDEQMVMISPQVLYAGVQVLQANIGNRRSIHRLASSQDYSTRAIHFESLDTKPRDNQFIQVHRPPPPKFASSEERRWMNLDLFSKQPDVKSFR